MPISNVEVIQNDNRYAVTILDSHTNLKNIVNVKWLRRCKIWLQSMLTILILF